MADKGTPGDGPSLEMPSLPFGRRKGGGEDTEATTTPAEPVPTGPTPADPTPADPIPADPIPAKPTARNPVPTRAAATSRPAPAPAQVEATQALPPAERDHDHHRDTPDPARPSRRPQLPGLSGVAAALATGAVIGALGVLLVWLASVGCEAARGTASCGDGPGFMVLVAILAVLAYLGGLVLRAFGVPDAGSTSLLAVGVTAVLVLVLFTDALFEPWMALVVPVVAALAYALSWWVTTRVVQNDDDQVPTRL